MKDNLLNNQEAILAILKNLPGNFLILSPDVPRFTILESSYEYNRATLTKREDIIDRGIFEVFPDDPADTGADGVKNLMASFNAVINSGEADEMPIQRYPVLIPGTDEFTEKFWSPVNKPIMIEGKLAFIVHSVMDITESRLTKISEQYFRSLADQTSFMIWRNVGGFCTYVNRAWTEFTGLSLADSLNTGYQSAYHLDDVETQQDLLTAALASHSSYQTKFRIINRSGKVCWVFMKVARHSNDKEKNEYIGSIIDITEQELAKQAAEESASQFRQLADSIIQMVWVTDAQGMHEYYNQRWYDFTGTTHEQTKGEGWNQVFHPDDQDRAWKIWSHSLATGEPYEIEYRLRKYTGEYVWVLGRAAPYYDTDGKIIKWFGTCTDIHEQKLLQQQKDEFISVASHELKTPLTTLHSSLQFLKRLSARGALNAETANKLVESAVNNSAKLGKLVNNLLNVSRIDQGKLMLHKTNFDIVKLIRESYQYLAESAIPVKIEGIQSLFVFADELKMEQVLVNLLTNALKYAPQSEEIRVTVAEKGGTAKISVTDQGDGIPADRLPYLFDRYYRAVKSQFDDSGMGLGLYISADIIKQHKGSIGADSIPAEGSSFWFEIPVQ